MASAAHQPPPKRHPRSQKKLQLSKRTSGAHAQTSPLVTSGTSTGPLPTVPIEDPSGRGLGPFYRALGELESGRVRRVRMSIWGDSHIAGSVLTGRLRDRLQKRFGDAGPGFVLLGRPWPTYRQAAARQGAKRRWRAERLWTHYSRRRRKPRDDLFGIAGISTHTRRRATAWIEPRRGKINGFDLYYLRQPGGGRVDIRNGDGKLLRRILTLGRTKTPGYARVEVGHGLKRLEFTPGGGEVRLFGVDTWRHHRGIIVDAFGINGARIDAQLQWNPRLMRAHLTRLEPQLVVLAYGSNEVDVTSLNAKTLDAQLDRVLKRMRQTLPHAGCLLIGPPDQARHQAGQPYFLSDRLDTIIATQRAVARRRGCGFWDQRRAMGGPGSVFTWVTASPPLARHDHVHLYGRGYRLLADALFDAILMGYHATTRQRISLPPAHSTPTTQVKSSPQNPQ